MCSIHCVAQPWCCGSFLKPSSPYDLKLPEVLKDLTARPKGLVLVTRPTGSGKSTTLAAMIDWINRNQSCHILTIEDPVEFVHESRKSLIRHREEGLNTLQFHHAYGPHCEKTQM